MSAKQITSILSYLLFLLVLFGSLLVLFSQRHDFLGWQLMIVKSGSMEPAIRTGSLALVRQQQTYQVGDIVSYRSHVSDDLIITHRILEKNESDQDGNSFILKGDANQSSDTNPVGIPSILGKVQLSLPLVGYAVGFLQTIPGVILFIVIPGTLLIYEELKALHERIQQHFGKRVIIVVLIVTLGLVVQSSVTWASYKSSATLNQVQFRTARWLEPLLHTSQSESNLNLTLENVGGFDGLKYTITYTRLVDTSPVQEQIAGEESKAIDDLSLVLPPIFIGTCSASECTPHQDISQMDVVVELTNGVQPMYSLNESILWVGN